MMGSMKDCRELRERENYSMSRVVVPLKNTDMMCMVKKNINDVMGSMKDGRGLGVIKNPMSQVYMYIV
jgi:hypothetical protein